MQDLPILLPERRRVEQLAARRAHNPEAAGSSPAPAKKATYFGGFFFALRKINWEQNESIFHFLNQ